MYSSFSPTLAFVLIALVCTLSGCSKEKQPAEPLQFDQNLIFTPKMNASRDTSWDYLNRGRIDSAVLFALHRIQQAEEKDLPKEQLVDSYKHLSIVLRRAGAYELYQTYILKSLDLYQKYFGNKPNWYLINIYASIATSYLLQEDYDDAIKYYRITQNTADKIGEYLLACGSMNNIGITYLRQNNLDSAKIYFERAQNYYHQKQIPFDEVVFAIANNLGDVYYRENNYDKSIEYYKRNYRKVLTMPAFTEYDKRITTSNIGLAKNAFARARTADASLYLDTAEAHLPHIEFNYRLELASNILDLRLQESFLNKDLDKYHNLSIQSVKLNDSIQKLKESVSSLAKEKMAELQIELARLKIDAKDRELLIAYKEKQNTWVLAGMSMVIIFLTGGFLWILGRRRHKQLQAEKLLALSQLEKNALKEEKMKLQLSHQKQDLGELSAYTQLLHELTTEVKNTIKEIQHLPAQELEVQLKNLSTRLTHHINSERAKKVIQSNLSKVNSAFFDRLDELPLEKLGKKEKELCALFRLNLSDEQIAEIKGISQVGVRVARSRIRKKMGLKKTDDLHHFLVHLKVRP